MICYDNDYTFGMVPPELLAMADDPVRGAVGDAPADGDDGAAE